MNVEDKITSFFQANPALTTAITALDVECRYEYQGGSRSKMPFSSLSVLVRHFDEIEPIFISFNDGQISNQLFMEQIEPIIRKYYDL